MGLLSLPALWAGQNGETVLRIMAEAAERIVPLRFTYVHAELLTSRPAFASLRVNGKPVEPAVPAQWILSSLEWPGKGIAGAIAGTCSTPLGELKVVRLDLKYGAHSGNVWFGSDDMNFPSMTELASLRAAASLAATGLQTARAMYDREEASRAKDEFLAMLGHELRNPLAPIVTSLDLIKRKSEMLPREYVIIDRQVHHLRRLVDDLLDVARITRGDIELRKESLDLHYVLTRAIESVNPLIEERRHLLTIKFADASATLFGDLTRLTQVFANLLTNAAKYTDPQGTIVVTTRVLKDHVSITIEDNGVGISAELYPRLFTIFEQGSSTIERSRGGLGIGLALVRKFVELHGGSVNATSAGVGCGSEFTVLLPLLHHAVEPIAPSASTIGPPTNAVRVLLVDDNRDALESMVMLLQSCGYPVLAVDNPIDALKVASDYAPTVALIDIGLPVMDGYQLGAALRQQCAAQPLRLIALTGYGQAKDRARSILAGFDGHLVKPARIEELIAALVAPTETAVTTKK